MVISNRTGVTVGDFQRVNWVSTKLYKDCTPNSTTSVLIRRHLFPGLTSPEGTSNREARHEEEKPRTGFPNKNSQQHITLIISTKSQSSCEPPLVASIRFIVSSLFSTIAMKTPCCSVRGKSSGWY